MSQLEVFGGPRGSTRRLRTDSAYDGAGAGGGGFEVEGRLARGGFDEDDDFEDVDYDGEDPDDEDFDEDEFDDDDAFDSDAFDGDAFDDDGFGAAF